MSDKIIGLNITSAGLGGDIPQVNHTGYTQFREKRLFLSEPEIALIIQKNVRGGYGDLEMGTVMAVETATGFLVPYVPDTIGANDVGRTYLAADNVTSATVKIWPGDMGKVKAGDVIVLCDTDAGEYEEATVASVALDAGGRMATVTLTGATTTTGGFTVAKSGNYYLKAGPSGKRSVAKYILDQHLSTGTAENPNGAHTSVVVSNATLYKDALVGADATALTALGAVEDHPYVILK